MSTQAVSEYLEKLNNDDDLKAESELEGKTKQERIAAAVELAGKRGFDFTEDEFATVLDALRKVQSGELEDAELETVAGGVYEEGGYDHTMDRMRAGIQGWVDWLFGDDEDGDGEDGDTEPCPAPEGTAIAGIRG